MEGAAHVAARSAARAAARPVTTRERLRQAIREIDRPFTQWSTHGDAGVSQLRRLADLLDHYGAAALATAAAEALTPEAPGAVKSSTDPWQLRTVRWLTRAARNT